MNNILPESDFSNYKDDLNTPSRPPNEIAWAGVLDHRYGLEVKRIEPYKGLLCIFDLDDNNKLMYNAEVRISFDARFGADAFDVAEWQNISINIIDNI